MIKLININSLGIRIMKSLGIRIMKKNNLVFIIVLVALLFASSCSLKEIEVKASPSIQTPITKDVILLMDLIDIETIENTLKESFQPYAQLTRTSNYPLTYSIEVSIFNAGEILKKLGKEDFKQISQGTYNIISSDSPTSLLSFSEIDLGILKYINFISLPATLLIKEAEGIFIEATLTYCNENNLKVEQNKEVDLSDLINTHEDIKIEEMSIKFEEGFSVSKNTTIAMTFEFPFKFTTTEDIELYSNKADIGEEDIFRRKKDSGDDMKDIINGINSLKVYMDYLNTTGLFFKINIRGWEVNKQRETDSKPIEHIIFKEDSVVFDLNYFLKEIKEIIPYNFLISIYLPESSNEFIYELNLDGEVKYIIWMDLGIDINIPIEI